MKSLCYEHFRVEAKNLLQVFEKGREGTQKYRSCTEDSVTFSGGFTSPPCSLTRKHLGASLDFGSEVLPAQAFPSEDALSNPTPGGSPSSSIHQLPHLSPPPLNTG